MPKDDATPMTARFRRGEVMSAACPSREILNHLTSRWGVLVLIALQEREVMRFAELRRRIGGVSERMLSQTLKLLEADGFVAREAKPVVPPHVEYRLTPLGREAAEKVAALAGWVEAKLPEILRAKG